MRFAPKAGQATGVLEMKLAEANQLLDNNYLAIENGWLRLDDGSAHVCSRTHMVGCSGEMVKWWFGFIHHTEQYKWWHARDHVFSDWEGERGTGRYIGGTHLVHEYLGGGPTLHKLKINFLDPSQLLDVSKFEKAKVSAAIFGRIGMIGDSVYFGRLLNLVQDIPEGCVMRSRFWLGVLDQKPADMTPDMLRAMVPDELPRGLQQHASEEMSILASFLPTVYRIHNPGK